MKCNVEAYFEKNTNMFLKNTNYCLSDQFCLRQQDHKDAIRIIFEKKPLLLFFRSKLCANYWTFVPNKPIIFAGSGVKFLTYFLSSFTWESYSFAFAWSSLRSYFWSVFSCIRTEYGKTRSITPYSVRMQENVDQK